MDLSNQTIMLMASGRFQAVAFPSRYIVEQDSDPVQLIKLLKTKHKLGPQSIVNLDAFCNDMPEEIQAIYPFVDFDSPAVFDHNVCSRIFEDLTMEPNNAIFDAEQQYIYAGPVIYQLLIQK